MEIDDEGIGGIDGAYFAKGVVIGDGWVKSGGCVQGYELCIEGVVSLFKTIEGANNFCGFAGECRVWEVFGKRW